MAVRPTLVAKEQSNAIAQLALRIESEIEFARTLMELAPAKGQSEALTAAEALSQEVFSSGDAKRVAQGVEEIEAKLSPFAKLAKRYTIYCVGHAHIDMNWMWGWPETVSVTNDTFGTVLKLMEEFPTFVFSQSQASVYRIIEQYNPAMLEQIRQRVAEGRWEITASHWVEGDRNMVSGESLMRHLLYTRKYMKELFNLSPEDICIDWSPDTFGHPITVPMYLRRGGVRHVYLHRPGAVGPARPQAFWWESRDGSRVLVRNDMAVGYNGQLNPSMLHTLKSFCKETGLEFSMYVYGVGDHGGGPTRRDLSMALEMDTWKIFPNIKFARARDFYDRLEKQAQKLPTLKCELNFEFAGCYTTQSLVKRSNRVAEHRLLDAEVACTIAATAAGAQYPAAQFEQAWRDTLFGHFHDILPGSNVHDSRTWLHGLFQNTIATTMMSETLALRKLAEKVDTLAGLPAPTPQPPRSGRATLGAGSGYGAAGAMCDGADTDGGGPRAIVVFNPAAFARTEMVEATIWTDVLTGQVSEETRNRPMCIRRPDGRKIPVQKLEHAGYWGHAFVRIAFPAEVPAAGYASYALLDEAATEKASSEAHQITTPYHCGYVRPDRRPEGLRNEFVELHLDTVTGGIARLVDLRTGQSCSGDRPWSLEYVLEHAHGMTAWTIGNTVAREQPVVTAIDWLLDGPYKASLRVKLKLRQSEFTLTYELRAGDPRVHIHLKGTWMERGGHQIGVPSLRYVMPLSLSDIQTQYEVPFGMIDRDLTHNEEVPSLNVAVVTGKVGAKTAGFMLLNDSKHGHSLDGNVFGLTLIRSAYDPDPLPDIGEHEVRLCVIPITAAATAAQAICEGKAMNRPLRVFTTSLHDGQLPPAASALSLEPSALVLTELKRACSGPGIIIRIVNPSAKAAKAKVTINPVLLGKLKRATDVDAMERDIRGGNASITGNTLSIEVPARGLASVKLT